MSPITDYLSPLVKKQNKPKKVLRGFCGIFPIMWHGIVPHESAKSPQKDLPDLLIPKEEENSFYSTVLEVYKDANDRIDKLEEKAFKLLSYISALSVLIIFFITQLDSPLSYVFLIISTILLFVAILLSLRCIDIKTRKTVFIDALYDFKEEKPKQQEFAKVLKSYIDSAIYNQSVADNTADIFKASKYFLLFAFIMAFFGLMLNFQKIDIKSNKAQENIVTFKDSSILKRIEYQYIIGNKKTDSLMVIENHRLNLLESALNHRPDSLNQK